MKVVYLLAIIFSVFSTNSAGPTPIIDLGLDLGPFSVRFGSGYRYRRPYYGGIYDYHLHYDDYDYEYRDFGEPIFF